MIWLSLLRHAQPSMVNGKSALLRFSALGGLKRTTGDFTISPLPLHNEGVDLSTEPQNSQEKHSIKNIRSAFLASFGIFLSILFIYGGDCRGRFALHCVPSVAVSEPVFPHRPNLRNLSDGLFSFLLGA